MERVSVFKYWFDKYGVFIATNYRYSRLFARIKTVKEQLSGKNEFKVLKNPSYVIIIQK